MDHFSPCPLALYNIHRTPWFESLSSTLRMTFTPCTVFSTQKPQGSFRNVSLDPLTVLLLLLQILQRLFILCLTPLLSDLTWFSLAIMWLPSCGSHHASLPEVPGTQWAHPCLRFCAPAAPSACNALLPAVCSACFLTVRSSLGSSLSQRLILITCFTWWPLHPSQFLVPSPTSPALLYFSSLRSTYHLPTPSEMHL